MSQSHYVLYNLCIFQVWNFYHSWHIRDRNIRISFDIHIQCTYIAHMSRMMIYAFFIRQCAQMFLKSFGIRIFTLFLIYTLCVLWNPCYWGFNVREFRGVPVTYDYVPTKQPNFDSPWTLAPKNKYDFTVFYIVDTHFLRNHT